MLKCESAIVSHNLIPGTIFRPFSDKCAESPKITLLTLRGQRYLMYGIQLPLSPKVTRFALRPDIFELQDILRLIHRMTPI